MSFQLTRIEMSHLLYALKGESEHNPFIIFKNLLDENHHNDERVLQILAKVKKKQTQEFGLSTNEIVSLANLCELTSLKSTSIQNWIKRDVKELIGPPELGKKYSIEQTAMLLIVKDLKSVFDFEKIRQLLTVVFNTLSDRSDDLISPITFYELYAHVLETLEGNDTISILTLETSIINKVEKYAERFSDLTVTQWEPIRNVLVLTVLSVIVSHIQSRAYKYLNECF
ncbi:DUF1836 domain-containing protein [Metabacillus malikii]|uniref:DUF1836 domain-containing protein n=1 Tax=Metabacillus malikii TaxID=1504265 RepID=A0ABT9ZCD0_9BACI|nr:DUF1836 domain-containing protein [Metabacillus malikii]MDQ0229461.1 hypothetical protein [Metabacillus malikii]